MLLLADGTQVKIISESDKVVKVQSVESVGFDFEGEHICHVWNLSKKYHKGSLFYNGVCVL